MIARLLLNLLATGGLLTTDYIGRVDTIGGTIYDWQLGGPQYRFLVCSEPYGLHAAWLYSSDPNNYPDRNERYNFYDFGTRRWNWIDSNFMQSGTSVFTARSGFGTLGADPATGGAVLSTHQGLIYPVVARDVAPGGGLFDYCTGQPQLEGYLWPVLAVSGTGTPHLALLDDATRDRLYYSRAATWCNWGPPLAIPPPLPDPMFPCHNIAASRSGSRVAITWVDSDEARPVTPGFFRESPDDGATWGPPTELPIPNPYGPDTVASFHISSLCPYYDSDNNLHIVASVMPVVHDTAYVLPAAIYHWCSANTPRWNIVHRTGCDSLAGSIGYNALYATRPSIGQNGCGRLFIAWEQFHPRNVEPRTGQLRAGVWMAASTNRGLSWTPGLCITDSNTVSHRFPSMVDVVMPGDTVTVRYLMDLEAGFVVQGQGRHTENPVVVQFVPAELLGVKADEQTQAAGTRLGPTIVCATLRTERQPEGALRPELVNATGRRVMKLKAGENDLTRLAPGVYFLMESGPVAGARKTNRKIIIAR